MLYREWISLIFFVLQEALKAWLDSESDYRLTVEKAKVGCACLALSNRFILDLALHRLLFVMRTLLMPLVRPAFDAE
jgi:hypothetical protein